jgi:hypothetical protein
MFALGQNRKTPFTSRGKSAPRPKCSANASTVETVGDDAGESPTCTEGSGGRRTTAASALMFVAGGGSANSVSAS